MQSKMAVPMRAGKERPQQKKGTVDHGKFGDHCLKLIEELKLCIILKLCIKRCHNHLAFMPWFPLSWHMISYSLILSPLLSAVNCLQTLTEFFCDLYQKIMLHFLNSISSTSCCPYGALGKKLISLWTRPLLPQFNLIDVSVLFVPLQT